MDYHKKCKHLRKIRNHKSESQLLIGLKQRFNKNKNKIKDKLKICLLPLNLIMIQKEI